MPHLHPAPLRANVSFNALRQKYRNESLWRHRSTLLALLDCRTVLTVQVIIGEGLPLHFFSALSQLIKRIVIVNDKKNK